MKDQLFNIIMRLLFKSDSEVEYRKYTSSGELVVNNVLDKYTRLTNAVASRFQDPDTKNRYLKLLDKNRFSQIIYSNININQITRSLCESRLSSVGRAGDCRGLPYHRYHQVGGSNPPVEKIFFSSSH